MNIPVSTSEYTPQKYKLETIEDDRDSMLRLLNNLYENPASKTILYDVLHNGYDVPADISNEYKESLSQIKQSSLNKKEYQLLRKAYASLTFDYIVKALNILKSQREVNGHIDRIIRMQNNIAIISKGDAPFKTKKNILKFNEQKTLVSIIGERRKKDGKETQYTISVKFLDSILQEFNLQMTSINKGYTPKSRAQIKHMLEDVYIIINRNINSKDPQLGKLITTIEDVPFE